jgi:hypothetical protein
MIRPGLRSLAAAALLAAAATPARAEELLRGPHPFLKENALELAGGAALSSPYGGTRAAVTYDWQAAGSWWLELRLALWRASSGPFAKDPSCAPARPTCARLDDQVDVMVGGQYRLRTNLPVVPYARGTIGPTFAFPSDADRAAGLAARLAAGAKWYAYDWLGFGGELGVFGATTGLDEHDASGLATGLDARYVGLEVLAGVEVQF